MGAVAVVQRDAAEQRMNYPIVMITPEIERIFSGVSALPTTFVIDREGAIVQKHLGLLNAESTEEEVQGLAGLVPVTIERVSRPRLLGWRTPRK